MGQIIAVRLAVKRENTLPPPTMSCNFIECAANSPRAANDLGEIQINSMFY
jgi:hypothetical protein